jgi:rhamnopyranosyl-N-acetylglucosaminyl-diphospho-decaprenol beta-1,3/1,4-galactofuranosyltransferase
MNDPCVVAVVVTYNRRELLQESLDAIDAQARRADTVIVIDNASTDGTPDAVRERAGVDLHVLDRNTGGAGGFAYGIAAALRAGADLIWLMDDDTVPEPDALAALLDARTNYRGKRPALVASRVVWTDGRDHPMNTPRPKPLVNAGERAAAESVGCIPVRSASFVSILVDADVCKRRGAPVADYFLWNDDFEFSTRVLRGNVGLLCPHSVVVHKTRTFGSTDADPGERFYYEVRNKVWMLTRSRSLAPMERTLYAGSTLRRWVHTILRSSDRPVLMRGLRRGLRDGLRGGPRSNQVVLAGTGYQHHSL